MYTVALLSYAQLLKNERWDARNRALLDLADPWFVLGCRFQCRRAADMGGISRFWGCHRIDVIIYVRYQSIFDPPLR